MNQLLPLILVWLFANNKTATQQASLSRGGAPPWPTPNSPPPMPAFAAQPFMNPDGTPHSADPSHTSTPLAELHNAPPTLAPAHKPPSAAKHASPTSAPETIKEHAVKAFTQKAKSRLTQAADQKVRNFAVTHATPTPSTGPTLRQKLSRSVTHPASKHRALSVHTSTSPARSAPSSSSAATTVSVADLQQILNRRGAKLKADGKYGPKTASAWQSAAKKKGLAPTIARVSANSAKVVAHTYDVLSIP